MKISEKLVYLLLVQVGLNNPFFKGPIQTVINNNISKFLHRGFEKLGGDLITEPNLATQSTVILPSRTM